MRTNYRGSSKSRSLGAGARRAALKPGVMGAEEIAHQIKSSLVKCDGLSSDPPHPHRKAGMAVCMCNPNAGGYEQVESGGSLTGCLV